MDQSPDSNHTSLVVPVVANDATAESANRTTQMPVGTSTNSNRPTSQPGNSVPAAPQTASTACNTTTPARPPQAAPAPPEEEEEMEIINVHLPGDVATHSHFCYTISDTRDGQIDVHVDITLPPANPWVCCNPEYAFVDVDASDDETSQFPFLARLEQTRQAQERRDRRARERRRRSRAARRYLAGHGQEEDAQWEEIAQWDSSWWSYVTVNQPGVYDW